MAEAWLAVADASAVGTLQADLGIFEVREVAGRAGPAVALDACLLLCSILALLLDVLILAKVARLCHLERNSEKIVTESDI